MEALLDDAGQPISRRIQALHTAMLGESKRPKASDLGIIGKDHFEARLGKGAAANSFEYRKIVDEDDTTSPWIFEACFAWLPRRRKRLLEVGLNHSPALAGGAALPVIMVMAALIACSPIASAATSSRSCSPRTSSPPT